MTESTQDERRLIIKQMELAGIPNALQLWREIENEIDLVGYNEIFNRYCEFEFTCDKCYAFSLGALLYEYYVIDEDVGIVEWYLILLNTIYLYGLVDSDNDLPLDESLFPNDLGLGCIKLLQVFRETAPELDQVPFTEASEHWINVYRICSVIHASWLQSKKTSNHDLLEFLTSHEIKIGGNENALVFAYHMVCDDHITQSAEYEHILQRLEIKDVSTQTIEAIADDSVYIERDDENKAGEVFLRFIAEKFGAD